ncbi:glucosaminidase domain-containing protein [Thalassotalea marina]|uniref:Glycoside hydrolase family 73 n=1 Tax=Thalassotalea marina TaxID=1673741 RepID=A0A919EKK7_9GAMM|nr:glucosaminidase domain-containing protein [Thalassotalea marina]GHF90840.1 glycoside hydrolase family 73 [Thalassotalea marina]
MKYINNIVLLMLAVIFAYALIKPLSDQSSYKPKGMEKVVDDGQELPEEEQPLHDVDLPDFAAISDIEQKKLAFFSFLKPSVDAENARIKENRDTLLLWRQQINDGKKLSNSDKKQLDKLAKKYKVKTSSSDKSKIAALLMRVDQIPTSLVLVQAANESAWGTSRFARIGLNFFGVWCYKKGCGMVPNSRTEGLKHEVAAFTSVEKAIAHYIKNINTNSAYQVFRQIRSQLRENDQPLAADLLATGLLPYSERGTDYVLEISEMLRHNQEYIRKSAE